MMVVVWRSLVAVSGGLVRSGASMVMVGGGEGEGAVECVCEKRIGAIEMEELSCGWKR